MARRARLLTAEDVLDELELEEDDFDADEPMMPGSDDEFSDLEDVEDDDNAYDTDSGDEIATPTPPTPPPRQTPSSNSDTLSTWSSTLKPVTIQLSTSPVGPKVAIPDSRSGTFDMLFTPALMDTIVEQSNLCAKEVMGDDKYSSWVKITREELIAESTTFQPWMTTGVLTQHSTILLLPIGYQGIALGRSHGICTLQTTPPSRQGEHLDTTGWERCGL